MRGLRMHVVVEEGAPDNPTKPLTLPSSPVIRKHSDRTDSNDKLMALKRELIFCHFANRIVVLFKRRSTDGKKFPLFDNRSSYPFRVLRIFLFFESRTLVVTQTSA